MERKLFTIGDTITSETGNTYKITDVMAKAYHNVIYLVEKEGNDIKRYIIKDFNPDYISEEDKKKNFNKDFDRFDRFTTSMLNLYYDYQKADFNLDAEFESGRIFLPILGNISFKEYVPKNLSDLLNRLISIAKVIHRYHANRMLLINLCPENIILLEDSMCHGKDSPEVQILECDAMPLEDAKNYGVTFKAYIEWTPTEIHLGEREQFVLASDIFALGEMLYYKLLGTHSDIQEHTVHGHYELEKSDLLREAHPSLLKAITQFLRYTLCGNPLARYQTTVEAIRVLELIKAMVEE